MSRLHVVRGGAVVLNAHCLFRYLYQGILAPVAGSLPNAPWEKRSTAQGLKRIVVRVPLPRRLCPWSRHDHPAMGRVSCRADDRTGCDPVTFTVPAVASPPHKVASCVDRSVPLAATRCWAHPAQESQPWYSTFWYAPTRNLLPTPSCNERGSVPL